MSTRTRFEKEAKGNSEMAYFKHFALWIRFLPNITVQEIGKKLVSYAL